MDWPRPRIPMKDAIGSFDALAGTLVGLGKFAGTASVAWPQASRTILVPVPVTDRITVTKMAVALNNAGSGNLDIGIYDKGGNRLVSSGSVVMSATGFSQLVDITDTPLQPGVYYMALALSATTNNVTGVSMANAALVNACGVLVGSAATFPMPATSTFAANTIFTQVPSLYMLQRTIG